jgi:hypothetical protein
VGAGGGGTLWTPDALLVSAYQTLSEVLNSVRLALPLEAVARVSYLDRRLMNQVFLKEIAPYF